jgi:hypothetical protein
MDPFGWISICELTLGIYLLWVTALLSGIYLHPKAFRISLKKFGGGGGSRVLNIFI